MKERYSDKKELSQSEEEKLDCEKEDTQKSALLRESLPKIEDGIFPKTETSEEASAQEESSKCLKNGNACFAQKNYEKAIEYYDAGIKISAESHQKRFWNNKGMALYKLNNFIESERCFQKALECDPHFEPAQQKLKLVKEKIVEITAGNSIEEETAQNESSKCLKNGNNCFVQKDFKKAIECYDEGIKIGEPTYQKNFWHYKGRALYQLGNYIESEQCAQKTLEIDPHFEPAQRQLKLVKEKIAEINAAKSEKEVDKVKLKKSPGEEKSPVNPVKIMKEPLGNISSEVALVIKQLENNELTTLELKSLKINTQAIFALAKALPQCKSLTHLNLRGTQLGKEATKALWEVLPHCGSLTNLSIAQNDIGDNGAKVLAAILFHCKSLSQLDLSDNDLGVEGIKALAEGLSQCRSLTHLNLSYNPIRVEGARALAGMLSHCKSLTHLNLGSSRITAAGACELSIAFPYLQSLQSLDIYSNGIEDAGMKALAGGLTRCTELRVLKLGGNHIGDEGAKALAEILMHCPGITDLNLYINSLSVKGAQALAPALSHCKFLANVDLGYNNISDKGTQALALVLQNCKSLTDLGLSGNSIKNTGAKSLLTVLAQCSALRRISLIENKISYSVNEQVKEIEKKNAILSDEFLKAAAAGNLEVLQNCIARGASVWSRCDREHKRDTALHVSARAGQLKIMQYLIKAGVPFSVLNNENKTPLEVATEANQEEIAEYLKKFIIAEQSFQKEKEAKEKDVKEKFEKEKKEAEEKWAKANAEKEKFDKERKEAEAAKLKKLAEEKEAREKKEKEHEAWVAETSEKNAKAAIARLDAHTFLMQSRAHLNHKRYTEALESAKKSLEFVSDYSPALELVNSIKNTHSLAMINEGNVCFTKNQYEKALEHYDTGIQLGVPEYQKYFYDNKAKVFLIQKKYTEARECAKKCLAFDPNFSSALQSLKSIDTQQSEDLIDQGAVFLKNRQYEKAIECYDIAIKLGVKEHEKYIYSNKATAFMQLKQYSQAEECNNKALKRDANFAWALQIKFEIFRVNVRATFATEKQCDEAVKAADIGISGAEVQDQKKFWDIKAKALLSLNKLSEALECAKKLLEIDPSSISAQETKQAIGWYLSVQYGEEGYNYCTQKEFQKGIDFFDAAIKLIPENLSAYLWKNKARAFLDLKNYSEALKCAKKALEIDPNLVDAQQTLKLASEALLKEKVEKEKLDKEMKAAEALKLKKAAEAKAAQEKAEKEKIEKEKIEEKLKEESNKWMKNGNDCYAQKDFKKAIEHYDAGLRVGIVDHQKNFWHNKGLAFYYLENYSESENCTQKALTFDSNFEPAQRQLKVVKDKITEKKSQECCQIGLDYFAKKDWKKALEYFDAGLALGVIDHQKNFWNNKGIALCNLGNYVEADKCTRKALELDPNLEAAQRQLQIIKGKISEEEYRKCIKSIHEWYAQNNHKKVVECCEAGLKIEIKEYQKIFYTNKGISLSHLGNYAEAETAFQQALVCDPNFVPAQTELETVQAKIIAKEEAQKQAIFAKADLLASEKKYAEALECLEQLLKIDSGYVAALKLKIQICVFVGRYKEALAAIERIVEISPDDIESGFIKVFIFLLQGKYAEAHSCNDQLFKKNADKESKAQYLELKGKIFQQQGKYVEALECFEEILTVAPHSRQAWNNKGHVLFCQKKYDEAFSCFTKMPLHTGIGRSIQISASQGKAAGYLSQGNKKSASQAFEQADALIEELEHPTEMMKAWSERGELFYALGEFSQAKACFEKAQSIFPYDFYTNKLLLETDEMIVSMSKKAVIPSPQVSIISKSDDFIPSSPVLTLQPIEWKDLEVGELIGNGGFGDVHKAKWHGKEVAVKTLYSKTLSADMKKVFDQEAEVMAACSFPHVIRLYGVCTEVGHYAMVMELMPRGSLYHILHNAEEKLPWAPLRWQISLDTARGISYLHGKNILHRDLKSLNILLDNHYQAKISDFGLAKTKIASSSSSSKSGNKGLAGSLRWSAPELVDPEGDSIATRASDIYSFGMVLWEIASRKLPYEEVQKEMAVGIKILQGKKEKIPLETPEFYGLLIQSMWNSSDQRPTAKEVVAVLEKNPPPAQIVEEKEIIVEKSWHFDAEIPQGKEDYYLIPAGEKDYRKVMEFYLHHAVPGLEVQRVEIIYNPELNRGFFGKMRLLQKRANNPAFKPKWATENHAAWRGEVDQLCKNLSRPYSDPDCPAVQLLPLWHGTRPEIMTSIFTTGYANLATTDSGFFGKGLYSAYEAEYSYRVYSKGALILNWVAFFSAYPVIDGDMDKLSASANYGNHDAHFVPVVPQNPHNPNESVYYPTKPKQKHTYTEVVVFEAAQCLPRYVVHLQKVLLNSHGFFKQSHAQIDLFKAANDVYQQYLSKPYTLKTHMEDWQYTYGGITIQRPNHGLALVLRKACYVPFVIQYFVEFNRAKLSPESIKELENSIPEIQLALLFSLSGRENDCSNNDNAADYFRFRQKSAEIFETYVKDKKFMISPDRLAHYCDAIRAFDYGKSPFHVVMTIAHMIDTLRCFRKDAYENIMSNIANYVGAENSAKLKQLAYLCNLKTGDRIIGMEPKGSYQGKLFVDCSQNVEICVKNINGAVKEWEQLHQPALKPS